MNPDKLNSRGGAILLLTVGISIGTLLTASWGLRSVLSQKNLQRRISQDYLSNLILEQVITKVLTDLKLASRFPDAVALRQPPLSPNFGGVGSVFCDPRDPNDGNRFTLDAYLVPFNRMCQIPHPGNYGFNVKNNIIYPKGAFRVPFFGRNSNVPITFLTPETDPQVRLSRIGPERYRIQITFGVCTAPVNGRIPPDPNDPLNIVRVNNTLGVAWNPTCPPNTRSQLNYDGFINTNTPYFQN